MHIYIPYMRGSLNPLILSSSVSILPSQSSTKPLTNGAWKTILSYFEGNFLGAFAVKLQVGNPLEMAF